MVFLTEEKLQGRIKELQSFRYLNRTPIKGWKAKEDISKDEKYPPKVDETWTEFSVGSRWEGRDIYLWIQTEYTVPVLKQDEEIVLLFYFGKTGSGHNSGFESLLFINEVPYQGVDSNHTEVFLRPEHSGQTLRLAIRLWSGLEGGGVKQIQKHCFEYGDSAILSQSTDDLYFTSKVMLDTVLLLDENHPIRYSMLNILEKAYKIIDWSNQGDEAFYQSVSEANAYINLVVRELPKDNPVSVTAIGHTHIDVAWLWRLKHTREKAARSFSTVLQLMERYPEYIFLQTQPQLYKYIKKDYPRIYDKIKEKIAEGTWEIDGGMWVEADCNISSGESLVRQILYGVNFIKDEFGKEMNYLWLPDVFGYSWALPQILKKSNINTFMTTKISWNQYNRMPHDTFKWRGIDGSEVLTHFITTPEPVKDPNLFCKYTYNGLIEPLTIKGIYDNYRNKDINKELLISYGHGDGGGGVTREMLENRRRIDMLPGLPSLRTGTAKEYFEKLHAAIEQTDNYVHTWDGELYLEYHRGTYTSQAFVKKWNRKLELAYREQELLHSWALLTKVGWQYPQDELHEGWEIILRNQFHDIIPGSSIHEVYEDAQIEYLEAHKLTQNMKEKFQSDFPDSGDNKWTIINSAGWKRSEILFIPVEGEGYFTDSKGNVLVQEKVREGYNVYVFNVNPLSSQVITFVEDSSRKTNVQINHFVQLDCGIETPYYFIAWDADGRITDILDKENNRQVLSKNGYGNQFVIFEDKPIQYDAWDIDLFHFQKSKTLNATSIDIKKATELSWIVEFIYEFGTSRIVQEMVVYANSGRIDFRTKVDWNERQQLLKVQFDVDIRATQATYNIQYGSVKRPTHWNTSWDMARFESVAHQWVDFSEHGYGVSLLNDCKYGHSVKGQTISLSLLKGPIYPDPEGDKGTHEFTYSLLPHSGDYLDGMVNEEAWNLNSPLTVFKGECEETSLIDLVSDASVMIDALKLSEDREGIILRLHDHTGGKRNVSLKPNFEFDSWREVNLMEKPLENSKESTDQLIQLKLGAFEIKTILLKKENGF